MIAMTNQRVDKTDHLSADCGCVRENINSVVVSDTGQNESGLGKSDIDSNRSWYAMKVYFNKVIELRDELQQRGFEVYLPMKDVRVVTPDGKERKKQMPLIGSLMFVKSESSSVESLGRELRSRMSFYTLPGDKSRAASIPETQMELFRLVTSEAYAQADYLGEDSQRWHEGDLVRVTAGPLEGAVGHICRIKGNRRLVISIKGVCAIATSYVPARFLEPVETK